MSAVGGDGEGETRSMSMSLAPPCRCRRGPEATLVGPAVDVMSSSVELDDDGVTGVRPT